MRPVGIALALAILAAGCAAPDALPPAPAPEGPIDLTGKLGLLLLDRATGDVATLLEQPALAWMSGGSHLLVWTDATFDVVVNRTSGARHVGPPVVWARVYDNGTALELASGEAKLRELVSGNTLWTKPLGPTPREGISWTAASDDLSVVALEVPGARPVACQNEITIRSTRLDRTLGCHLRVAPDGRAGWTEATAVRMREADGDLVNVTAPGSGDPAAGTFVAHENPVFTRGGVVMLRITGGERIALTEIVDEEGNAIARMAGPRRLALHDVSEDGQFVLVRAFER